MRLPLPQRTSFWAAKIKACYPSIDVLLVLETYGLPFAENMHARHVVFDPERKMFLFPQHLSGHGLLLTGSISPESVRPYFVKKICFYGPESTGKPICQH